MTHPFGPPGDAASSPLQCSESRAEAGWEQAPDGAKVSFAVWGFRRMAKVKSRHKTEPSQPVFQF
ncbi:hypothetical protein MKX08_000481 [Trichoderma sp. CBMAI-0020]|nr:hypothetical protein MKX08_000481 [Trichoderma sp. CBMAI-0020]